MQIFSCAHSRSVKSCVHSLIMILKWFKLTLINSKPIRASYRHLDLFRNILSLIHLLFINEPILRTVIIWRTKALKEKSWEYDLDIFTVLGVILTFNFFIALTIKCKKTQWKLWKGHHGTLLSDTSTVSSTKRKKSLLLANLQHTGKVQINSDCWN